jgi:hypothetical protein
LGKDDGFNFSIPLGEKDFRTIVNHLDRHVDKRINRETRSQLRLKASLLRERQNRSEYLAFSAHLHLLVPAFLHLALADRPVDKPAKMPTLKFPRRAIFSDLHGTFSYHPTGSVPFIMTPFHDQEEEYLSFNMHGDVPPSLLKTLYGFKRNTQ